MAGEFGSPNLEEMGMLDEAEGHIDQMTFGDLESHPTYGPILQEQALQYLKEVDTEYFDREFSGLLDDEGYLLRKNGTNSNTKPSMNITGGMAEVEKRTKEYLKENLRTHLN